MERLLPFPLSFHLMAKGYQIICFFNIVKTAFEPPPLVFENLCKIVFWFDFVTSDSKFRFIDSDLDNVDTQTLSWTWEREIWVDLSVLHRPVGNSEFH